MKSVLLDSGLRTGPSDSDSMKKVLYLTGENVPGHPDNMRSVMLDSWLRTGPS
jgi:hypothetical protein